MDNSDHQLAIDFEEVTVARRVYRSGESEYLINGSPCRLKDVTELFYDTGIGKEGYSIIGQGDVYKRQQLQSLLRQRLRRQSPQKLQRQQSLQKLQRQQSLQKPQRQQLSLIHI